MSTRDLVGRRGFIAGAATVGAGTAVLSGCASIGSQPHVIPIDAEGSAQWGRNAGKWIFSACNMCGGQSGIKVQVVKGLVSRIEPNNWNPINYSNISSDFFDGYTKEFGTAEGCSICPKGNAGIGALYDPDRVRQPLKRTNPDRSPDADPQWQQISWEQAISEVAAKMATLRDAGEAYKLLWMSEDHSFTHPQVDFCELYGTPNYNNHSNLCDVSRKAAFKSVMGQDRPLADFLQSKYVLLFGWNPTSAIKWVHLPRIVTRGLENGGRLVVVDPYLSDTAAKGQEWVPIIPGTDGAFALALGHVIVRDKLYDAAFVKDWTVGFDQYQQLVSDKTPEWASKITGIPVAHIERIAHDLATTKPGLVDVWSGPGQQSNAVQGGRAIAVLNSLLGTWDSPGGMMIPSQAGPKHTEYHPTPAAEKTLEQPRFDELSKYPMGHKSGVYTQLFSNLATNSGPYQPKMMMIVFQNPVMAVPGRANVIKGLQALETLVVVDTMLSETAMMADYVLPGTTYLERYDLNSAWITWPAVSLRQPVVKPIFGQPAEYETVAMLGRALDLQDAKGGKPFLQSAITGKPVEDLNAWYEDYLSKELLEGGPKMTLDQLKALPGAVWVDSKGTSYKKYAAPVAAEKLATAFYSGPKGQDGTLVYDKPKDDGGKQIGVVRGGVVIRGFFTASGRAQFVDAALGAKKDANGAAIDPLPNWQPRSWLPSAEYPLYGMNWKEASHTLSRTQNNTLLLDIKPTNPVAMNPQTAAERGIEDGDNIVITSPYGQVNGVANVTKRMSPGVVGMLHGFGHTALGEFAKGRGTADGWLRPTLGDPIAGQAMHKQTCVQIAKA